MMMKKKKKKKEERLVGEKKDFLSVFQLLLKTLTIWREDWNCSKTISSQPMVNG